MHLIRYMQADQVHYGYLEGETIGQVSGDIYGEFVRGGPVATLGEVTLLAPCQPSKIVAVVYNFADRLRELNMAAPNLPPLHFKAPSAIIGPGEAIRIPPQASQVHHGAELAVVIGRRTRWVSPEEAPRHILGYTCANDVLALDVAAQDESWTRASSFDTFCPLGPSIATHVDPAELMMTCTVNGVTRQMSSTVEMLFGVQQTVAYISAAMTLMPGDVVLMGSPSGSSQLNDGAVVEVSIEHIGTLRNPVVVETGGWRDEP
jgi:2-keto-4-pentenoate hydratase/2-oxohepta-3-ene-1,7-dioic acid hydratase in catechol pathway